MIGIWLFLNVVISKGLSYQSFVVLEFCAMPCQPLAMNSTRTWTLIRLSNCVGKCLNRIYDLMIKE